MCSEFVGGGIVFSFIGSSNKDVLQSSYCIYFKFPLDETKILSSRRGIELIDGERDKGHFKPLMV